LRSAQAPAGRRSVNRYSMGERWRWRGEAGRRQPRGRVRLPEFSRFKREAPDCSQAAPLPYREALLSPEGFAVASSCPRACSNKARPKAVRFHRSRSACACRRGTASAGSLRGRVAMGSPGRRWSAINRGGCEAMRASVVAPKVSRCAFIGYGRTR
jgi:hypothetical protein